MLKKILLVLFLLNGLSSAQLTFHYHPITTSLTLAKKLYPADVNQDGIIDIVAVASNTTSADNIAWYENDGQENFTIRSISTNYFTARGVYAADLIPGGFQEIVAGTSDKRKITFWKYSGGAWMADSIGPADALNNYSVRVYDLDEDGSLDILASYGETMNKLVWFQGDGTGSFSTEKTIATSYVNAVDLTAGYIDGDNYPDIVGGAFWGGDDVSWWQNDGTPLDGGWIKNGIQSNYRGGKQC